MPPPSGITPQDAGLDTDIENHAHVRQRRRRGLLGAIDRKLPLRDRKEHEQSHAPPAPQAKLRRHQTDAGALAEATIFQIHAAHCSHRNLSPRAHEANRILAAANPHEQEQEVEDDEDDVLLSCGVN